MPEWNVPFIHKCSTREREKERESGRKSEREKEKRKKMRKKKLNVQTKQLKIGMECIRRHGRCNSTIWCFFFEKSTEEHERGKKIANWQHINIIINRSRCANAENRQIIIVNHGQLVRISATAYILLYTYTQIFSEICQ